MYLIGHMSVYMDICISGNEDKIHFSALLKVHGFYVHSCSYLLNHINKINEQLCLCF